MRPDAKIVVTGCAAQIDPDRFAGMDEVDHVIGNHEKTRTLGVRRRSRLEGSEKVAVNDIMSVRETALHLIDGFRLKGARLCADPERLRPSLHVLRHSVRTRAVALGAGGRGGGAGAAARRDGLCRDRADRCRHHRLRRGPSRRDDARQAGALGAQARARAAAPQAFLYRFDRGRCRADGGDRRGGTADAASPSFAASRATTSR